jgi:hypothetical protein
MRDDKRFRAAAILGLTSLVLSLLAFGFSRDVIHGDQSQQAQLSPQVQEKLQKQEPQQGKKTAETIAPEKVIPAFKNIKEQTAAYVFIGWIWVSIIVLIYILGNKIKEVDRLAEAKFFDSSHPPGTQ